MNELSLLLLILTTSLLALMATRWVSDRFQQPSVLGEMLLGVAMGNIGVWLGIPFFEILMHPSSVEIAFDSAAVATEVASVFSSLAELGAILLLFSAGLETSVAKLKQVGGIAVGVASIGVAAPFGLAFATCALMHVEMPAAGHLFLAATLSATSVGITASVLKEMGMMDRLEAKIILGAAVIDDVVGLVLLAIISRVAVDGTIQAWPVVQTVVIAAFLFGLTLWIGERSANRAAALFERLDRHNGREFAALALAFGLAWIAESVGLAAIVGAFAAGLVLKDHIPKSHPFQQKEDSQCSIGDTIAPLEAFLAPMFFLYVGMQVELGAFLHGKTFALAATFTICAVVGKLLAGLAAGRGLDRLSIGVGMVPRGEVGLVFLGVGRSLGAVSDSLFAALIVVVFATTIITPPTLKWSLNRKQLNLTEELDG